MLVEHRWFRKSLAVLVVLVLLAPVFGTVVDAVGYAEPIDVAAEMTGAADDAGDGSHGLFPDYTVAGLSSVAETLVSALVGVVLTLAVGLGVGRLLET